MKKIILSSLFVFFSLLAFSQEREQITCQKCGGEGYITERVWKKCTTCQGSGLVPGYVKERCPRCNGTGKKEVLDRNNNIVKVTCDFLDCNNGYIQVRTHVTCGTCKGKGGHYEDEEKICPRCNSKGKVYR